MPQNSNRHGCPDLSPNGSIPIIDYNVRNEKMTDKALRERGYDKDGWPYAPCGIPATPNGFDTNRRRLAFCCNKQCLKMKAADIKSLNQTYDINSCEHLKKVGGYSDHACIEDNLRLYNEVLRGTKQYNNIKRCRSASEGANSTIKETLHIIEKPIVYSKQRADILVQFAAITLLLYKAFSVIVKISVLVMKYRDTNDPAIEKKLQPHDIPKSFRNIIQREEPRAQLYFFSV